MILITGGAYQGKGDVAMQLQKESGAPIIAHLEKQIAAELRENKDPYSYVEALMKECPEAIVTMDELGCGIVPTDAFDRNWREITGRISCVLAKEAAAVYRVSCGLAMQIK